MSADFKYTETDDHVLLYVETARGQAYTLANILRADMGSGQGVILTPRRWERIREDIHAAGLTVEQKRPAGYYSIISREAE